MPRNRTQHLSLCMNCATELRYCLWLVDKIPNPGQQMHVEQRAMPENKGGCMRVYVTDKCSRYTPMVNVYRDRENGTQGYADLVQSIPMDIDEAAKPLGENLHGLAWTPAQDRRLLLLVDGGFTYARIAEIMGRTAKAIDSRLKVLRRGKCKNDKQ